MNEYMHKPLTIQVWNKGPSIYYVHTKWGGSSEIGILRTGAYGGEGVQTDAYVQHHDWCVYTCCRLAGCWTDQRAWVDEFDDSAAVQQMPD